MNLLGRAQQSRVHVKFKGENCREMKAQSLKSSSLRRITRSSLLFPVPLPRISQEVAPADSAWICVPYSLDLHRLNHFAQLQLKSTGESH